MNKKIIVALDFAKDTEAYALAEKLSPQDCRLKIGKAMFSRYGTEIVKKIQDLGFELFLDLKYHDIPNTVQDAVLAAADLGVWMVNIHAQGGSKMMKAAVNALKNRQQKPYLIAVSVLTSLDNADLSELGIPYSAQDYALKLAKLSYECGLDGVVCSAQEARTIKNNTSNNFLTICPGIRNNTDEINDQSRTMTAKEAVNNAADFLVIGRPITKADNPVNSLNTFLRELT